MLIQIKNWKTDDVIFELDKEDNTKKETVEEAVRQGISLHGAYLFGLYLHGADLRCADLCNADLRYANLSEADLRGTNLYTANLFGAKLNGADLTGANIRGTYLEFANLNDSTMADLAMVCPETGSFIGYKKIWQSKEYIFKDFIVKLEIPEDAKRSSATSNKCRCSKAKVLEIRDMMTGKTINEVTNLNRAGCTYKVGEYVYPDSFDECRWHECSHGIHFFMTEDEAIKYLT